MPAPVFNAQGVGEGDGGTTVSCTFTVGAISNTVMLISVTSDNNGAALGTMGTPTVNGSATGVTAYSALAEPNDGVVRVSTYYLINPPTGSVTVQAINSVSLFGLAIHARTYTGVHQTTPLGTAVTASNFGSDAGVTVNVSTTAGDLVVDFIGWEGGGGSRTAAVGASQNSRSNDVVGNAGTAGSDETAAGATTTMSWTLSTAGAWVTIAGVLTGVSGGATDGWKILIH